MQPSEIIAVIEKIAPPALAASWDNSGMQVAGRGHNITTLAVALDPVPSTVRSAAELRAGMLLTHHPLLLSPRLPAALDTFHETLRLLFAADMALYAAHTPLDAAVDGPAGWPAQELELSSLRVLEPVPGGGELSGFGFCGLLPEVLSLNTLLAELTRHVDLNTARLCGPPLDSPDEPRLRRVAFCPGSGASLVHAAARAGADIFITGDVKYHIALESPIPLLDVGHHALEEEMTRRLAALLHAALPETSVHFLPSAAPFHPAPLMRAQPAPENTR